MTDKIAAADFDAVMGVNVKGNLWLAKHVAPVMQQQGGSFLASPYGGAFAVGNDDAAIVNAVISLGHSLRMRVVAEGVETGEQLEYLARHKCEEAQGFLFSRPLVLAEFEKFIRKR